MSYDDSHGSGGRRQEGYGGGRQEGYGGGGGNNEYGSGRPEGYGGGGRQEGNNGGRDDNSYGSGRQQGYGGGNRNDDDDNRGERRHGGGGGNEYGGQGGEQYNSGHQQSSSSDFSGAMQHAQSHSSSDETSLFSSALGFLSSNKSHMQNQDVDEEQAIRAHQSLYGGKNQGGGGNQRHDSQTLGMGAAMQAMKMFGQGGAGGQGGGGVAGTAQGQNQFIGMAMAQASRLFDEQQGQGKVVSLFFLLFSAFSCSCCWFSLICGCGNGGSGRLCW